MIDGFTPNEQIGREIISAPMSSFRLLPHSRPEARVYNGDVVLISRALIFGIFGLLFIRPRV